MADHTQSQTARREAQLDAADEAQRDTSDITPAPPSSLDLDRSASAVRSGRATRDALAHELTHTDARMAGGDLEADAQSAYSVGDEAPGGDNPTPDQDIVDEIGAAVGLEFQDNEELGGERKLEARDRRRWELDPASSDDYQERQRD